MEVRNRVALVTGSTSGIGAQIARDLHARGAQVVLNSANSPDQGHKLSEELVGSRYFRADISVESQTKALVQYAVKEFGALDVVINNAARTQVVPHHDLAAITDELWHKVIDTNVLGTWHVIQASVAEMSSRDASQPPAVIINLGSLAGIRQTGSSIPYAVSKAAIHHLTTLVAKQVGPAVRVNSVAPGLVDTPWTQDWQAVRAFVDQAAPMRRSATIQDVSLAALALIENDYITGQIITVDGGLGLVV